MCCTGSVTSRLGCRNPATRKGCGLLIADLTFGNRNVYHEIGYLMGLNRGKGLAQDNFVLTADKKMRSHELETDIGFNLMF